VLAGLAARLAARRDPGAIGRSSRAETPSAVGIGQRSAQELIAEIGVTMTAFPTAAHLVSWAKFAPIDKQSAGRAKTASTGKGNPWLAGALGEIVAGLAHTDTFLSDR
jgi:transposase